MTCWHGSAHVPYTASTRRYRLYTDPSERTREALLARHPAGCVRDGDGRPVGAWWVSPRRDSPDARPHEVGTALCRTPSGPRAFRVRSPPGRSMAGDAADLATTGRNPALAMRVPFPRVAAELATLVAGGTFDQGIPLAVAYSASHGMRRPDPDATEAHLSWMRDAVRPFLEVLDPEAVTFAAEHLGMELDDHAWTGLDGTFSPGAPLRRAVRALPEFGRRLVTAWHHDPEAMSRDMANDDPFATMRRELGRHGPPRASARLAEAVAAHRSLRGGTPTLLGSDRALEGAIGLLNWLPAESVPRGEVAWVAYLRASTAVHRLQSVCGSASLAGILGAVHDWEAWAAAHARAAGVHPDALHMAVHDLRDMAEVFVSQLALGAHAATSEAPPGPFWTPQRMLHGGRGLARMLAASARWHASAHAIDDLMAGLPGSPPPAPPWSKGLPDWERDGLELRILTSEAELADEGRRGTCRDGSRGLGHCVAGYATSCRSGSTRIASVRHVGPDGATRLSTVELRVASGGVSVAQHRGHGNADPPAESVALVDAYLALMGGGPGHGDMSVDDAGLAPVPASPRPDAPYDARIPGNWEAVAEAWAPHLPRVLRGFGPEAFLDVLRRSSAMPPDVWRPCARDAGR